MFSLRFLANASSGTQRALDEHTRNGLALRPSSLDSPSMSENSLRYPESNVISYAERVGGRRRMSRKGIKRARGANKNYVRVRRRRDFKQLAGRIRAGEEEGRTSIYVLNREERRLIFDFSAILMEPVIKGGYTERQIIWNDVLWTGKNFNVHDCFAFVTQLECVQSITKPEQLIVLGKKEDVHPQSWVVLLVGTQDESSVVDVPNFSTEAAKKARSCKHNIITKSHAHHKSRGVYLGYGTVAVYRKDAKTLSSIATYACKKGMQDSVAFNESYALLQRSLAAGTKAIDELFIGQGEFIKRCCAFMMTMNKAAVKANITSLEDIKGTHFHTGFWNINASTDEPHAEEDGGYTLITVPPQEWSQEKQRDTFHLYFEFRINDELTIKIPMTVGTSFWFHGMFLTHRQQHNDMYTASGRKICCVNCSSYTNKKTVCHSLKSIPRSHDKQASNNV